LYLSLDEAGTLIQSALDQKSNQVWTTISTGQSGYCCITTRDSTAANRDQCLEIKRGRPDDYIGLGNRRIADADDQLWAFEEVQPGYYVITSKRTRDAIDVPYGNPKEKRLILWL
jgi:hypothetical protein